MARKSEEAKVYLGFVGSGAVTKKETKALLSDYLKSTDAEVTAVVPVTKEFVNDNLRAVVDVLGDLNIPYEIVVDRDAQRAPKGWADVAKAAFASHEAVGPVRAVNKVISLIQSEAGSFLVALWDDDDDLVNQAVAKADEKALEVRDLTAGLSVVDLSEDGEDDEVDDDTNEENEMPRGKKVEEEVEETEEVEEAEEEFEPYTEEELAAFDRDELREIAVEDFGIDVGERFRVDALIKKILAAQAEGDEEETEEDDETEEVEDVAGSVDFDVEAAAEAIAAAVASAVEETTAPQFDALTKALAALTETVESLLAAQEAQVEEEEPEPEPTPRRRRPRR